MDKKHTCRSTVEQPLGMAWYKFLIYFALIAGAIINLIYSFGYISGSIYSVETNGQISADQVYAYYGLDLQIVDVLYGFFLITFAILAFIVRHKLANYASDSIKFVNIFYSLYAGIPFLYAILVSVVIEEPLTVKAITSAIVSLALLLLNKKYFDRRAHLFVDKAVSTRAQIPVQPSVQPVLSEANTNFDQILFCRKCGERLVENGKFCRKCGIAVIKE